jgi:PAT family beta-lactamase induction signal transducer AmpG
VSEVDGMDARPIETPGDAGQQAITEDAVQGQIPSANPWWFVPPLYFMQAIPAAIVNEVSPLIYKEFGIDNAWITRWTSLAALPWAVKMFFGPFVELNSTRRRWILITQILIVLAILGVAFAVQVPNFPMFSIAFLAMTALFSATCDIATDGFYLMSLSKERQAAFAGVLTTSSRFGRLFCTSILVMLAGFLEKEKHLSPTFSWLAALCVGAAVYGAGRAVLASSLPQPAQDVSPPPVPGENWKNLARTLSIVATAFFIYFCLQSIVRMIANGIAISVHSLPLLGDLKGWTLTPAAFLADAQQLAVCAVLGIIAGWTSFWLMHKTPTGEAFGTFFSQSKIGYILLFIVFYRMSEAMVGKITPLFLKDTVEKGGMGMTTEQIGFYSGTLGVVGIILGGIAGGLLVSRLGLRRAFWPLAIAMHLPNLLYLWAAKTHPPIPTIGIVALVDQMGYGIGFAAYMVYLMQVAQRSSYRTSHYAIATGLGVLCIQVSGILSGIIQTNLGYVNFFIAVMFLAIPGVLTLLFIPLDEKKTVA